MPEESKDFRIRSLLQNLNDPIQRSYAEHLWQERSEKNRDEGNKDTPQQKEEKNK